jgi:N-acetylglucosamine kinase-like BadF-type ATPase
MDLVVGVDAGGTGSRAVVATVAGTIVGRGTAGAGNPVSGGAAAIAEIAAALSAALSGSDPTAAVAGTLGVAGTGVAVDEPVAAAFAGMWAGLGLRCPVHLAGDVITAFAAGTPAPDGSVLIAGTGAVAARIEGHAVVRHADGLGWLLGDEGSGRWLGLQALRVAVRDWSSPLASAVAGHTGIASADALVRWAQTLPMAAIDGLAPVVCAAAMAGDPRAGAIVADAVGRLVATLGEVHAGGPVVLAGGLLTGASPVRNGVVAALAERDVTARTGHDPAAAAA